MDYTVIICTMARQERAATLRRAIDSVFAGNRAAVQLVVVVNGQRFDAALLEELTARSDIAIHRLEEASSPLAILAGRRLVASSVFSYLDDDDEYLPGAIDARLRQMVDHPNVDVVASNGWRRRGGRDQLALKNLTNVAADPLGALFVENWLPSCGVSFRAATVSADAFENLPRHIHWSFLAYRLALAGKVVAALDQPTFIIHDTPESSSKQESYLLCHIEVYERMLAAGPPRGIRAIVAHRLSSALHEASDHFRSQGRLQDAWRAHLRSLTCRGGLRFLGYTRHLLRTDHVWPATRR